MVPPQLLDTSPTGTCSASKRYLPKNQHTADVADQLPAPMDAGAATDHGRVGGTASSCSG
jgi:hypothetical protein